MFSIQNHAPMHNHEANQSDVHDDFDDWPAYVVPICKAHLPASAPAASTHSSTIQSSPHSQEPLAPSMATPFPFSNKPDHFPGMLARSGLFCVARPRNDATQPIECIAIKAQSPYAIAFCGIRLTMSDKRVIEAVVRLAKSSSHDITQPMECSLRAIANAMGWKNVSGTSTNWIWESLVRLTLARIDFRLADGVPRSGKLLASVSKTSTGLLVSFDPGFVVPAFGIDLQFAINIKRREALATPLAKWLHDFVSTHTKPYNFTVKHLREITGYDARAKSFPAAISAATSAICAACPELAESFPVKGSTKASDNWTAMYTPGPESANFFDPMGKTAFPPAVAAKPRRNGLPPAPATRPRRGGVAL